MWTPQRLGWNQHYNFITNDSTPVPQRSVARRNRAALPIWLYMIKDIITYKNSFREGLNPERHTA
jgi:hypothetical protein